MATTDCNCPRCRSSAHTSRIDTIDDETMRELMVQLQPQRAVVRMGATLVAMMLGLLFMAFTGYQRLVSEGMENWKALIVMVVLVALFHLLGASFLRVIHLTWVAASRYGDHDQDWVLSHWGHRHYCRQCGTIFGKEEK